MTLDTRHSTLDTRHSTLDTRHSTLDTRHSTLDNRQSTIDNRQSAIDNRQSTIDQELSVLQSWVILFLLIYLVYKIKYKLRNCYKAIFKQYSLNTKNETNYQNKISLHQHIITSFVIYMYGNFFRRCRRSIIQTRQTY